MSGAQGSSPQFLRKVSAILVGGTQTYNFDESFKFTFEVTQRQSAASYNTCRVRLMNLSDETVNTLLSAHQANTPTATILPGPVPAPAGQLGPEYTKLILQAGYQPPGNFGTIFQGTIVQFSHGRENNVNTYLDVYAQDGDLANFAVVNQTLAGPVDQQQQINAIVKTLTAQGFNYNPTTGVNPNAQFGGVTLPRGKVLFGSAFSALQVLGNNNQSTWTIQNGQLKQIPLAGYLPGDIVVINSQTGLIGTPETTQQGISLTCLLNPKILIGQRIKLNNNEINTTIVANAFARQPSEGLNFFASVSADGTYRVCVVEHSGDTRGNEYYTKLVVLAVDPSAPPATSVQVGNQ